MDCDIEAFALIAAAVFVESPGLCVVVQVYRVSGIANSVIHSCKVDSSTKLGSFKVKAFIRGISIDS
jgi:hypothetical protein